MKKKKRNENKTRETYLLSFSGEAWNASILGRARKTVTQSESSPR